MDFYVITGDVPEIQDNTESIDISSNIDDSQSVIDQIRALKEQDKSKKAIIEEDDDLVLSNMVKEKKSKKKKKNKSAKKQEESDEPVENTKQSREIFDVEAFIVDNLIDEPIDESIIKREKQGYNKLKKTKNEFKKEFAEELTLLYNLLDETSNFGKQLEGDLKAVRGTKVRGVNKYTNDLAELVLSSKQNKLSILKEIAGIKKIIADLTLKNEARDSKNNNNNENSSEYLASAYLKNILTHGRSDFVNNLTGSAEPTKQDIINTIKNSGYVEDDDDTDMYMDALTERLQNLNGDFTYDRSEEGSKYIEYENAGVQIYVSKCIDTGEWEFVALDKHKQKISDYPVPSKRSAGRMKFSDDGTYCTDSKSRMYKVLEYYLPSDDDGMYDD